MTYELTQYNKSKSKAKPPCLRCGSTSLRRFKYLLWSRVECRICVQCSHDLGGAGEVEAWLAREVKAGRVTFPDWADHFHKNSNEKEASCHD